MRAEFHRAVLSFGSNDFFKGRNNIDQAIEYLNGGYGEFTARSEIYTSKPCGLNSGDKDYYNCVGFFKTHLSINELEKELKNFEVLMGRQKDDINHEVPVDIDIVMWEGVIVRPLDYEREYFKKGYDSLIDRYV